MYGLASRAKLNLAMPVYNLMYTNFPKQLNLRSDESTQIFIGVSNAQGDPELTS
jgi:hypothetical protein